MRLYNTLTRREEEFAPSRDNTVRMYTCGLTVYARGHIGNFRTFVVCDVLRRALKYEAGFDMRHVMNFTDVDDRTIVESNKAGVPLREYTDALRRRVPRGRGRARPRAAGAHAARDRRREHRGDGADDCRARGERAHLPERRFDLLQDLDAARLRQAGPPRPQRHQGGGAGRQRQVREGRRPRLRAVEGDQAGRADLGPRHRPGPPRLAHRVLGDGAAAARRAADRSARRRRRPDLPASRERDRAGGRGDRPAVLALLVARRASDDRGDEAAATRCRSRSATSTTSRTSSAHGLPAVGAALPVSRRALPQAAEVLVDRDVAGGGVAQAADRFPGAARPRCRRERRTPASRPAWTRRSRRSARTSTPT